jgi:hypothetical protein
VNRHRSANLIELPVVVVRAMILEESGRRSSTLLATTWIVMTRSLRAGLRVCGSRTGPEPNSRGSLAIATHSGCSTDHRVECHFASSVT